MKRSAKAIVVTMVALLAGVAMLVVRGCGDGRIAVLGPAGTPIVVRLDDAEPVHLVGGGRWAAQVGQGTHQVRIQEEHGHGKARVAKVHVRQGGEQWVVPASLQQCFVLLRLRDLAEHFEHQSGSPGTKLVYRRLPARPWLVPEGSELPENFARALQLEDEGQQYRFLLSDVTCAQLSLTDTEIANLVVGRIDVAALPRDDDPRP